MIIWQENSILVIAIFGHSRVIDFDNRPFANVEEMDQAMIDFWNMRVQKDDEVYIIGDFCYRSEKGPVWYLKKLKGQKSLILGNHDVEILKDPHALSFFEKVEKMMHVTDGDKQLQLCHFPLSEWHSYFRGSYHIYGHLHNRKNEAYFDMKKKKNALNAAACINNYMPVTIDELIANNRCFQAGTFDVTERKRFNYALDEAIQGLEFQARCYSWQDAEEYQEVMTFLKGKKNGAYDE